MNRRIIPIAFSMISLLLIVLAVFFYRGLYKKDQGLSQNWQAMDPPKAGELPWIKFEWVGDSIGKRYFDKLAMMVPVKLEGLPHQFKFQFDFGANVSMIYENPIQPYIDQYTSLKKKIVLDKNKIVDSIPLMSFKNINLTLDNVSYTIDNLVINRGFGENLNKDSVFTATSKLIGTLGADACKDKVLIIDYPNKRFCLLDAVPAAYQTKVYDLQVDKYNKVILQMEYMGKSYRLLYDNGSSLFPLITFHDKISLFSAAANTDTLTISSWGHNISFAGRPMKESVTIGGHVFTNVEIYANLKTGQDVLPENCDALTGNALFWNNIIVLDFKNKKFGLL